MSNNLVKVFLDKVLESSFTHFGYDDIIAMDDLGNIAWDLIINAEKINEYGFCLR